MGAEAVHIEFRELVLASVSLAGSRVLVHRWIATALLVASGNGVDV